MEILLTEFTRYYLLFKISNNSAIADKPLGGDSLGKLTLTLWGKQGEKREVSWHKLIYRVNVWSDRWNPKPQSICKLEFIPKCLRAKLYDFGLLSCGTLGIMTAVSQTNTLTCYLEPLLWTLTGTRRNVLTAVTQERRDGAAVRLLSIDRGTDPLTSRPHRYPLLEWLALRWNAALLAATGW